MGRSLTSGFARLPRLRIRRTQSLKPDGLSADERNWASLPKCPERLRSSLLPYRFGAHGLPLALSPSPTDVFSVRARPLRDSLPGDFQPNTFILTT